jgi:murein L,D-transpeptidase YcbB/YkuD
LYSCLSGHIIAEVPQKEGKKIGGYNVTGQHSEKEVSMKKIIMVTVVLSLSIYLFGCRKKEVVMELPQESLSMEALSTQGSSLPATPSGVPSASIESTATVTQPAPAVESLPPPGPYKPSITEIQTALKNAGYYSGSIDGKKGPLTKKATEEFQKANGLEADGKVGPKTWAALSAHLAAAASEPVAQKGKPGLKTR